MSIVGFFFHDFLKRQEKGETNKNDLALPLCVFLEDNAVFSKVQLVKHYITRK